MGWPGGGTADGQDKHARCSAALCPACSCPILRFAWRLGWVCTCSEQVARPRTACWQMGCCHLSPLGFARPVAWLLPAGVLVLGGQTWCEHGHTHGPSDRGAPGQLARARAAPSGNLQPSDTNTTLPASGRRHRSDALEPRRCIKISCPSHRDENRCLTRGMEISKGVNRRGTEACRGWKFGTMSRKLENQENGSKRCLKQLEKVGRFAVAETNKMSADDDWSLR